MEGILPKVSVKEEFDGGSDSFLVTVEGNGESWTDDIHLHSRCFFCLRKTGEISSSTPRGRKRARLEVEEERVPLGMPSWSPTLLQTLQWMWWTVRHEIQDLRDIPDSKGNCPVAKFVSLPRMCEDCGVMTGMLDNLHNQMKEQLDKLNRLVTEGRSKRVTKLQQNLASSGLEEEKIEKSLAFLGDYRCDPCFIGESAQLGNMLWEEEKASFHSEGDDMEDANDDFIPESEDVSMDSLSSPPFPQGDEQDEKPDPENLTQDSQRKREQTESSVDGGAGAIGVQIPPGAIASIKRGLREKPLSLHVKHPLTGKEFAVCLVRRCGHRIEGPAASDMMDAHHAKGHQLNKNTKNVVPRKPRPSTEPAEGSHQCDFCEMKYTQRGSLQRHLRKHHHVQSRVPGADCNLCKAKLNDLTELRRHLEDHVGQEYVLRCVNSPKCAFVCVTFDRMRGHFKNSHCCRRAKTTPEAYFERARTCQECGFFATDMTVLTGHLNNVHETATKNFTCPMAECELGFTCRQSVIRHLKRHEVISTEKQSCLQCEDKKRIPVGQMEDHLKEIHGVQEMTKCVHCPFLFSSREEMMDHLFVHRHTHKLLCDICGEGAGNFSMHAHLLEHYWKEHQIGGPKSQCDQCPKVFWNKQNLKSHKRQAHSTTKSKEKPEFPCDECGQIFKAEESLRGHKIREHGAEPFSCAQCTSTFTSRQAMLEHIRVVHKGVKKQDEFPCLEPNCGAVFRVKNTLKRHHLEVHLGQKGNHVCEQCGKPYWEASLLKTHQETAHLGVRKHVCQECGEAFVSSSVLRKHMMIHTGERPFACDTCGQRFRHKDVLRAHEKGHQKKGDNFKPNGPMKQVRKRVVPKKE